MRMVPGGKGLAFIEFADEITAGTALAAVSTTAAAVTPSLGGRT